MPRNRRPPSVEWIWCYVNEALSGAVGLPFESGRRFISSSSSTTARRSGSSCSASEAYGSESEIIEVGAHGGNRSRVSSDGSCTDEEQEISRQIAKSNRALEKVRCRVGALWLFLAVLTGILIEVAAENYQVSYCSAANISISHGGVLRQAWLFGAQGLFEFGFSARFLLLGLAPLADAPCLTRLVLTTDTYVFVHTRTVSWFTDGLGGGEPFSLFSMVSFYLRGFVFAAMAVSAMLQRSPERMQSLMWTTIATYAVLNSIDKGIRGLYKAIVFHAVCICSSQILADLVVLYIAVRPSLRHRLQRRLRQCLQDRASSRAAACVACLLSGAQASQVIAQAKARFRCISLDTLGFDDIKDNRPNHRLYSMSTPVGLGRCDAFVSHSWHDDAEAKWTAMQSWRENFRFRYGRDPEIWFDKVCIDQSKIDEDLACLPIFLNGCRRLVIFCGTTYLSRLWCIMEIFIYVHMGGRIGMIEFVPVLRDDRRDGYEDLSSISRMFENFDVDACQCANEQDRQKMLLVIRTAFCGIEDFNRVIRDMVCNLGLHGHTTSLLAEISSNLERSQDSSSSEDGAGLGAGASGGLGGAIRASSSSGARSSSPGAAPGPCSLSGGLGLGGPLGLSFASLCRISRGSGIEVGVGDDSSGKKSSSGSEGDGWDSSSDSGNLLELQPD